MAPGLTRDDSELPELSDSTIAPPFRWTNGGVFPPRPQDARHGGTRSADRRSDPRTVAKRPCAGLIRAEAGGTADATPDAT